MATGPTHVRLVRCPKCRQLLPEIANLSVYSCGGCGALLQAKNWKKEAKSTGPELLEPDVVKIDEPNRVSEDKERRNLQNEANPSLDYLADHNSAEEDQEPGITDLSDENIESQPTAGAKLGEEVAEDGVYVGVDDGMLSESSISELSGMLMDMAKSSITIGSHAYDGSVSSYDRLGDNRSEMTHKPQRLLVSGEKLIRRERFLADSVRYIDYEMKQHQPRKWMPESSGKKKLYGKEWDREEMWEPARRHQSPRNWTQVERSGAPLPPKVPLYQGGLRAGRSSSQEYQCDRLNKPEKQDEEKMKLLRMIYELQNQLDKSGKANGRVTGNEKKNIPTSYNLKVPEQFKFSRAANNRNNIDSKCLHCQPRDWQSSAPLQPVIHHVHNCCNLCSSSSPTSTQQYMKPEISILAHESKSDDQRFKDHMMKKYSQGNHHVAKRHFRPKAGGAPFVTCYHCLNLLQLPEDFLALQRRCHRLSCGSCSTILKFSVQNRTHIIPYPTNTMEPPPSEVDECSGVMDMRSTALSSHASNCPHNDLVYCSDDSGLSFCRSCSSRGDHASFKPLQAIQDDSYDRDILYAKKEFIRKQFRNKYKDPAPSSSKYETEEFLSDSEVQQPRGRSGSQLHRLMGYSSPSVVIRGTRLQDPEIRQQKYRN